MRWALGFALLTIAIFAFTVGMSRATSKGPPFCHKLGTTSAVVGRVLIFV
jgi:hypothetical protein